jgi:hypothetical protein
MTAEWVHVGNQAKDDLTLSGCRNPGKRSAKQTRVAHRFLVSDHPSYLKVLYCKSKSGQIVGQDGDRWFE